MFDCSWVYMSVKVYVSYDNFDLRFSVAAFKSDCSASDKAEVDGELG